MGILPFEITRYLLTLLKNIRIEIYLMGLVERIYFDFLML